MKTRLTQLLGIQAPIIQPGMGLVADANLVASVCNAGGLGILASLQVSPEDLRNEILKTKDAVGNKIFGVNLTPLRPGFKRYVDVILEEKVLLWSSGLGDLFKLAAIKKPDSVIYVATVGTDRQAVAVEKTGADVVIVQGWEGGGHTGRVASTVLIPQAAEAVKIPVVAAGGFCDGRGLVAALALGAEGVAMGTRFAIAKESPIPLIIKKKYIDAKAQDAIVSDIWDGLMLRGIPGKNRRNYHGWWTHPWDVPIDFFTAKKAYNASFEDMLHIAKTVKKMGAPIFQYLVGMETYRKGLIEINIEDGVYSSGQVTGRIREILGCEEIIQQTIKEAEGILMGFCERYASGSK